MKPARYDAVIKDLFQRDRPSILGILAEGHEIVEFLNVEMAEVFERRADLLVRLTGGSLLHLEFQTFNDPAMAHRAGVYGLMADWLHRGLIDQVVIYLGEEPMDMPDEAVVARITVHYRLIDIREYDAKALMDTGTPSDLALAMLARGGKERLREIVLKAMDLPEPERGRLLTQMALLAGLRHASEIIKMEYEAMGVDILVEDNVILKDILDRGVARGRAEMLREMLNEKFHALPAWAETRLRDATPVDLASWGKRAMWAQTLEDVFGTR